MGEETGEEAEEDHHVLVVEEREACCEHCPPHSAQRQMRRKQGQFGGCLARVCCSCKNAGEVLLLRQGWGLLPALRIMV